MELVGQVLAAGLELVVLVVAVLQTMVAQVLVEQQIPVAVAVVLGIQGLLYSLLVVLAALG